MWEIKRNMKAAYKHNRGEFLRVSCIEASVSFFGHSFSLPGESLKHISPSRSSRKPNVAKNFTREHPTLDHVLPRCLTAKGGYDREQPRMESMPARG